MIVRTVLANGVRVVTEAMPEVRSASIGFWIGAGSRDEPAELAGSSHFLEHLLFKGTDRHSALDIAEVFDAIGGESNAFSSKEYTCVHGRVLDRDLEMATDYLGDMVAEPAIRPDDVASERRVVLEEIALRDDTPDDLIFDVFAEDVFGDHPLGRPVLGTVETVSAASSESVREFHRAGYHPRNIVVSAAGSIDHDRLSAWIASLFPDDDRPAVRREPVAASVGRRLHVVEKDSEQVHLLLGGLGYSREHADRFAWEVLDILLGGGMSSRLFQEIREKRGLVYSIYSFAQPYMDGGLFGIYAGTGESEAEELMPVTLEELRKVQTSVTLAELGRAKAQVKASVLMSLESTGSRCEQLARQIQVFGRVLTTEETVKKIMAVTPEDIQRAAVRHFRGKPTLAAMGPANRVPGLASIVEALTS